MQLDKTIILFCLGLIACSPTKKEKLTVVIQATQLNQGEGLVYFNNQPFSGTTVKYYADSTLAETINYLNGKRSGLRKKWFSDGMLSYQANYSNNKLHGFSKSWWKSGTIRSKSNFKAGKVHGTQYEYFDSGAIFKETNYNNGETKNGRFFGLKRSKLCFELEDEKLIENP